MLSGEEGDQVHLVQIPDADRQAQACSGHVAYAPLLAFHRIAVDPLQLRRDFGHQHDVTTDNPLRLTQREDGVRARIRLDRARIYRGDRVVPLTRGMAVTADIRTGERSIMGYLVNPFYEARQEAGS